MAIKIAHLGLRHRRHQPEPGRAGRQPRPSHAGGAVHLAQATRRRTRRHVVRGRSKEPAQPAGAFRAATSAARTGDFEKTIETINRYAKAETGLVRVASVPSIAISLLPPLLKSFHEQHPNFHLDIRDMDSQGVLQAVSADEVDIGIASVPSNIPDLSQEFLYSDVFGVVCAADNPLCDLDRAVRWSDLEGQTFINSGIVRAIDAAEFRPIRENAKISVRNTTPSSRWSPKASASPCCPNCCCAPTAASGCDSSPSKTTASSAASA